MMKRWAVFSVFAYLLLLGGCETTKGLGSMGTGLAKDATDFWQVLVKADQWMRENLW